MFVQLDVVPPLDQLLNIWRIKECHGLKYLMQPKVTLDISIKPKSLLNLKVLAAVWLFMMEI